MSIDIQLSENSKTVIRYIRPTGYADNNLYGITIVSHLDYEQRVMAFSYSVCNGDNFSRDEGVARAMERPLRGVIPLHCIDQYGGIRNAVFNYLKYDMGDPYSFTFNSSVENTPYPAVQHVFTEGLKR